MRQSPKLITLTIVLFGSVVSVAAPPFSPQAMTPRVQYLPQIAVGGLDNDLHYRFSVFFVNNSSASLSGTGELFGSAGAPLTVQVAGGAPASSFDWSTGPGEVKRVVLSGVRPDMEVGWLKISHQGEAPVGLAGVFQLYHGDTLISQAGVLPQPAMSAYTIFYDSMGASTDTGMAFANPNDQPNNLTLRLFGRQGSQLAETQLSVPPNGHRARFISELFPNVAGIAEMEGSVAITSTLPLSPVTLRLDGLQLTTLPVIQGASPGAGAAEPISYSKDVAPLFARYACIVCHSPAMPTNNFDLSSHGAMMRGSSDHGPVIIPGDGANSLLVKILEGDVSGMRRMPLGGPFMSSSDVRTIKLWVDQGAQEN